MKHFISKEGTFVVHDDGSVVQTSGDPVDASRLVLQKLATGDIRTEWLAATT